MQSATPLEDGPVRAARRSIRFTRRAVPLPELREMLAAETRVLDAPGADDADPAFRWAVLRAAALRKIIGQIERGESFENETEVHGIRLGPVTLLGAPLEIFQAIKRDIVAGSAARIPLVLGLVNDEQGYAADRVAANIEGDYAAKTVPLWKHTLPYADIHGELVDALLSLDRELAREPAASV